MRSHSSRRTPRSPSGAERRRLHAVAADGTASLTPHGAASHLRPPQVKALAKSMKSRGFGVGGHANPRRRLRPALMRVLIALPLEADLKDHARSQEARRRAKDRKRKRRKGENDEVSEGLKEAETGVDQITKHATQSEVLRELFALFLRVLKTAPSSPLLPAVLQGVAKHVAIHRITLTATLCSHNLYKFT